MPAISVRLAQEQVEELRLLRRLGTSRLNALADALEDMNPTIRRPELRRVISDSVGAESAVVLHRILTGLAFAIRTRGIPPAELLKGMGESLRSQGWNQDELEFWHECIPIIERMVTTPSVVLTTKARDLAEDFERAVINVRIITDIRPVYKNSSDEIVGAEVIQTLRIEYDSRADNNTGTISFGVDLEDIKKLRDACERAVEKAQSASKMMKTRLGDEVLMPGES